MIGRESNSNGPSNGAQLQWNPGEQMNFRDYLTVLRERWFLVLLGLSLGLGLGGAAAFLSTPQYASSVKFFISTPDLGKDVNQAYQGSLLSEQKIKSYTDMATDRRIRQQVADELGFPIAPGVISASAKPDTVLMTLSAKDASPARAKQIVDAAAKDFSNLVAEVEQPEQGTPLVVARQIQDAQVPSAPISPKRNTDLALGLVLGLMAGMAAAVARHTLDRSVKSPDVLAELVGAPVLGATQYDPGIKGRPLIVHDQPRAPLAEAFRQLRTNLEYVDLDHTNKLIVITSALPHEGKTTTACNLAIAMAQAGNRVALVEADLRRPKAAEYLGMENAVGLTTVLTGQVNLDVALQPWGGGLLDFLGSGALPPNPSELLASAQMASVLAELNRRYDVVIFDAAPTLPVADAAVLAAHCHGVLFVSRHGWVRAEQVKAAAETIRRVSAPIFGVVLSMAPRSKRGGGYSYQYGYGYTYHSTGRNPSNAVRMAAPPVTPANNVPVAPAYPVSTHIPSTYIPSTYTPSPYTPSPYTNPVPASPAGLYDPVAMAATPISDHWNAHPMPGQRSTAPVPPPVVVIDSEAVPTASEFRLSDGSST
jgi:capsular exopolysaccharide synthesis family protein